MGTKTMVVCSKCGRAAEYPGHARGWLIRPHRERARAARGEMVIRCPGCITKYALRQAAK